MKIIGISGVARSGKDTFARLAKNFFTRNSVSSKSLALAHQLKLQLGDFLSDNYDINIFKLSDEEKSLIRPIMVAHGCAKRQQSKGQHWWKLLSGEIESLKFSNLDVVIITDIRFDEYENDEADWILKSGGSLVHIVRTKDGQQILPANIEEAVNDPKIFAKATHHLLWESGADEELQPIVDEYLTDHPELWKP